MQVNPTFVGEVRNLVQSVVPRTATRNHRLARLLIRAPSSGMLGAGLALASCNETVVFGSAIEHALAPDQCAKYFDWDEFSGLSTRLRTLSIKQRNVSRTGGKVCLTTQEYFGRDGHSWHWEQEALRALARDGLIRIAGVRASAASACISHR